MKILIMLLMILLTIVVFRVFKKEYSYNKHSDSEDIMRRMDFLRNTICDIYNEGNFFKKLTIFKYQKELQYLDKLITKY